MRSPTQLQSSIDISVCRGISSVKPLVGYYFKKPTSRFAYHEKLSLNLSSFVIRVIIVGLLLCPWFSVFNLSKLASIFRFLLL